MSVVAQLASIQVRRTLGDRVPICSWCTRIQLEGAWLVPLPAVVVALDGTDAFAPTICEACAADVINDDA